MSNKIDFISNYVKSELDTETTGHDYYHAERVMNNALKISTGMDVNLDVVMAVSLTHDLIDRKVTDDIDKSLNELESKLEEALFTTSEVADVIQIIQKISFSKGLVPSSLEGKIVQDADRLDALGAIGIARAFSYGGKNHRMIYNPSSVDNKSDTLSHFYEKLLKLTNLMNTLEAKKIAEERTKYMIAFLDKFYSEWEGRDV